jgi:iron-sulfur cluster repair protein YtfE (RIC family)
MDVLEQLIEEHRQLEQLIGDLEVTTTADEREPILANLGEVLTTHMTVEEERVYPIVESRLGAYMAAKAQTEHDATRAELVKLTDVAQPSAFTAALANFKRHIANHVREEEHGMFPQLRARAGNEIAALGDAHKVEREVQDELVVDN